MTTMWRKYAAFQAAGVIGCADKRGLPGHVRTPRTDARVYEVLDAIRVQYTDKSTPTRKQAIELATAALADQGVPVPGRSQMYQILNDHDRGRHTFGAASTRRSQACSPDRAYGTVTALYPGQEVQLDATPVDAMVLMADGRTGTVDMAVAIDVATRTIGAAILRPNAAKTVDATELLSKAMIPQQMLPGWDEQMSMARSYLPAHMLTGDELAERVAAKPVLDVRGVFVDRGRIFVSATFLRALEMRGITHRIASPYEPTAKPIVERVFKTISDDFVTWIPGYKGRSVAHRGRAPERDAVWPLPLLQALLDEWIISVYQNRPHTGLKTPAGSPAQHLSPNALYRALSEVMPGQVRTLSRDEWIALQPVQWRRINRYGVNMHRLVYDNPSQRFHALRRTKSANTAKNGKWEVRYDPTNLMQIWVRDEANSTWIECPWVLSRQVTVPFGLDVVQAVHSGLSDKRHTTDLQVLARAEEIHRRLLAGPNKDAKTLAGFSRHEISAARANLTRQTMPTTSVTTGDPTTAAPLAPPDTGNPPPATTTMVQPMTVLDISEGW